MKEAKLLTSDDGRIEVAKMPEVKFRISSIAAHVIIRRRWEGGKSKLVIEKSQLPELIEMLEAVSED